MSLEYWQCDKKGHLKKDYWSKKKKEPESQPDNSTSSSEANVTGTLFEDALIVSCDNISDAWVVDSRVSFHATPHKHYSKDYVKGDFGYVYLGDNEPCEIVGKRKV